MYHLNIKDKESSTLLPSSWSTNAWRIKKYFPSSYRFSSFLFVTCFQSLPNNEGTHTGIYYTWYGASPVLCAKAFTPAWSCFISPWTILWYKPTLECFSTALCSYQDWNHLICIQHYWSQTQFLDLCVLQPGQDWQSKICRGYQIRKGWNTLWNNWITISVLAKLYFWLNFNMAI